MTFSTGILRKNEIKSKYFDCELNLSRIFDVSNPDETLKYSFTLELLKLKESAFTSLYFEDDFVCRQTGWRVGSGYGRLGISFYFQKIHFPSKIDPLLQKKSWGYESYELDDARRDYLKIYNTLLFFLKSLREKENSQVTKVSSFTLSMK